MNRQHSFTDQVAEFLAEQSLQLFRSEDGTCFSGSTTAECGVDYSLQVNCSCTYPSLVRVIAMLPIAVPAPVHNDFFRVLNVVNQTVPCGGFAIDPKDGRVTLDTSALIPDGEHPGPQLRWLLFLNANFMNREAFTLIRLTTGALTVDAALALVAQESANPNIPFEPNPERTRWN